MKNVDSLLYKARVEVVRVQVERFHNFYESYFSREETILMARFFFESVYNLEDRAEWEELAYKTYDKVKNMIKETSRENIERLIELNSITDQLDISLAELLIADHWQVGTKLTQQDYCEYYKKLGRKEDRKKQLEIVLFNLKKFYELAHKPIAAIVIKPEKKKKKMLGVYPLFKRVELGYNATLNVKSETFSAFYAEIEKREWEFLNSMFAESKDPI